MASKLTSLCLHDLAQSASNPACELCHTINNRVFRSLCMNMCIVCQMYMCSCHAVTAHVCSACGLYLNVNSFWNLKRPRADVCEEAPDGFIPDQLMHARDSIREEEGDRVYQSGLSGPCELPPTESEDVITSHNPSDNHDEHSDGTADSAPQSPTTPENPCDVFTNCNAAKAYKSFRKKHKQKYPKKANSKPRIYWKKRKPSRSDSASCEDTIEH